MTDHKKRTRTAAWWKELNQRIVHCQHCERLINHCREIAAVKRAAYQDDQYWGKPVPNFGDPRGRILIVGLAPGAHGANRTGRMFTGDRSGDWLFRALFNAGFASQPDSTSLQDNLQLFDCAITNACHCAPPGNKPLPAEVAICSDWFGRLVDRMPVQVIVALGGLAWNTVWKQLRPLSLPDNAGKGSSSVTRTARPRFGHLAETVLQRSITMIGSYHPSQQNTFTGRLTESMLDNVFVRARQLLSGHDQSTA